MASIDDKLRLLQEIDRGFDITFDPVHEEYAIFHNGGHFQTVPYGGFDASVLEHIRKMAYINRNGDFGKYIDEHNERVETESQRRTDDIIEQTAKDLYKPIKEAFG